MVTTIKSLLRFYRLETGKETAVSHIKVRRFVDFVVDKLVRSAEGLSLEHEHMSSWEIRWNNSLFLRLQDGDFKVLQVHMNSVNSEMKA